MAEGALVDDVGATLQHLCADELREQVQVLAFRVGRVPEPETTRLSVGRPEPGRVAEPPHLVRDDLLADVGRVHLRPVLDVRVEAPGQRRVAPVERVRDRALRRRERQHAELVHRLLVLGVEPVEDREVDDGEGLQLLPVRDGVTATSGGRARRREVRVVVDLAAVGLEARVEVALVALQHPGDRRGRTGSGRSRTPAARDTSPRTAVVADRSCPRTSRPPATAPSRTPPGRSRRGRRSRPCSRPGRSRRSCRLRRTGRTAATSGPRSAAAGCRRSASGSAVRPRPRAAAGAAAAPPARPACCSSPRPSDDRFPSAGGGGSSSSGGTGAYSSDGRRVRLRQVQRGRQDEHRDQHRHRHEDERRRAPRERVASLRLRAHVRPPAGSLTAYLCARRGVRVARGTSPAHRCTSRTRSTIPTLRDPNARPRRLEVLVEQASRGAAVSRPSRGRTFGRWS